MTAGSQVELTKKDFETDQDVRWCPGCGDYAILAQVQKVFPTLGVAKEDFVVISGIGCSSAQAFAPHRVRLLACFIP